MSKGLSIHCHHKILVEYCYDYKERVKYIKNHKPKNEQKIRLRLFKILPKEAENDVPKEYLEADKAWNEAYKAWNKLESGAEKSLDEANKAWSEADKAWDEADKDIFHQKWCGCENWNGKELVFNS